MANSSLTLFSTITKKLASSFVNFFEKAFSQGLPLMEQIPLFPHLDSKSDVSEVIEWVFVGQDVHGRPVYVNYKNPDQFLVDDDLFERKLGL